MFPEKFYSLSNHVASSILTFQIKRIIDKRLETYLDQHQFSKQILKKENKFVNFDPILLPPPSLSTATLVL